LRERVSREGFDVYLGDLDNTYGIELTNARPAATGRWTGRARSRGATRSPTRPKAPQSSARPGSPTCAPRAERPAT
jgi:hypothetical protein